jgi:hypothetical protein
MATMTATLGFDPASGWTVVTTALPPELASSNQVVWCANGSVAASDLPDGWGVDTVRNLPEQGISIFASAAVEVDDPSEYPPKDLPLDLSAAPSFAYEYENQPAPNVSRFGPITCAVANLYLAVDVWFGTPQPDSALLEQAQAQLANLAVTQ